jgi:hypothetical protein
MRPARTPVDSDRQLPEACAMRTWTLALAMLLALTWQAAAPAAQSPASPRPVPDSMRYAEDADSARLEIAIRKCGQERHEHQVRHVLDVTLGRRGQLRESLGFICSADAGRAIGHDHHASP